MQDHIELRWREDLECFPLRESKVIISGPSALRCWSEDITPLGITPLGEVWPAYVERWLQVVGIEGGSETVQSEQILGSKGSFGDTLKALGTASWHNCSFEQRKGLKALGIPI